MRQMSAIRWTHCLSDWHTNMVSWTAYSFRPFRNAKRCQPCEAPRRLQILYPCLPRLNGSSQTSESVSFCFACSFTCTVPHGCVCLEHLIVFISSSLSVRISASLITGAITWMLRKLHHVTQEWRVFSIA